MPLKLEIVTIERAVYSADDVDMVMAPGEEGVMGVLPRHEPMIVILKEGELEIVRGAERELFAIGGGCMEVHGTKVIVMASAAEQAEEIDIERAERARQRAARALAGAPDRVAARQALADMRRASVRLKVARRRRYRPGEGAAGGE
jgi:F-type H+-transporting ATPase subunit epsilon